MTTARDLLQNLVPLNTLSSSSFDEAIKAIRIDQMEAGEVLFREGDSDSDSVYLLQGAVTISSSSMQDRVIKSGSDASLYAIAQLKPRQSTGTVSQSSAIARVDQNILDHIITMDEVSGIEIVEMEADGDVEWVFNVLSSSTFSKLPPANANQMLAKLESIPVKAHQVILTQGEPGNYYYLIREGVATVARKDASGKTIILNELSAGEQFGEEALLSNAPRNATIMMKTAGVLMRLTREDFNELLTEPMLNWVEQAEADAMIGQGAGILDVRTVDEFKSGAINNSLNAPLSQIRKFADDLDK